MVSFSSPLLLNPKNFSSLQRTPWAGPLLAAGIKSDVVDDPKQAIGESWEFSCDLALPSKLAGSDTLLVDAIAANPSDALSPGLVKAGRSQCEVLVKLLNADTPLSLQIHPADDNKFLSAKQCGKPESWLILDAEPGAGLYLGFSKSMSLGEIETHLIQKTFTKELLHFVPVKPGDFFEIAPGVPHAIGPGTVILEPQRIDPGKTGMTWRLWDWNRLYDKSGKLDLAGGSPRDLHIKESLSLLQPEKQVGDAYVTTLRKTPVLKANASGATIKIFPSNGHYQVLMIEIAPAGSVVMNQKSGFAALSIMKGRIQASNVAGERKSSITMSKGQCAFVPWKCLGQKMLNTSREIAKFSWIIPAGNGTQEHHGEVFEI